MSKRKTGRDDDIPAKNGKRRYGGSGLSRGMASETIQGISAVVFFVLAIFMSMAIWEKAGIAGHYVFLGLSYLFGVGYYLLPLILVALGIVFLRNIHGNFDGAKLYGSTIFLIGSLGIIDIVSPMSGGKIGLWVAYPLLKLFERTASLVFLTALVVISVLIAFNQEMNLKSLFRFGRDGDDDYGDEENDEQDDIKLSIPFDDEQLKDKEKKNGDKPKKEFRQNSDKKQERDAKTVLEHDEDADFIKSNLREEGRAYISPPLSLLERDKGKPVVGDVKANANIIKRTLVNFGIDVEMDEVSIGPSVTRYALKPAEGVKLSRIVALQNDLALALAAHPLRIEAPIPGKSLVGIEIPNSTKTTVGLGTLFSSEEFQASDKPLLVSLGKNISGKSHFANLGKMPHLLIAGATGSGKSVTIHSLIVSLLYRCSPEKLKFIMIDPKRVELTMYNRIPHLLTPVITDPKKAILSLKWAAREMERRYNILQESGVRDVDSYHKNIYGPNPKKADPMPFIIIILDELADIMSTYPRELEAGIVRLAQMSRAVGIHLILSTQRPSVNVITGLIKANIPARMALQVASQVDSRTILDTVGAEKLLGAGDMLYLSGEMSKPTRIQCAFISETEVKKVVEFLADSHRDELSDEINLTDNAVKNDNAIFSASLDDNAGLGGNDDDLYEEAKRIVLEAGKASTSYIQRKLRVGYSRAARLMDLLEERGVIGAADGSKPRSVVGGDRPTQTDPESNPQDSRETL